MDSFPEKINIDDLYKRKHEVEALKMRVFQKILSRVHAKIKVTSRQRNSEEFCFFVVPEFLVGTPLYDSAACIAYVMEKLLDNGFFVKYTHPNLLFISWRHYIDKPQRVLFKKANGYAIDGFGNPVREKLKADFSAASTANQLVLKTRSGQVNVRKAPEKNYKDISAYRPTGNLIYDKQLLRNIESRTQK